MFEELQLFEVQDPGVPNLERIPIFVKTDCELRHYCILLGHLAFDGTAIPLQDHMLWFGSVQAFAGDWIYVYTAPGTTSTQKLPDGGTLLSIHWGKEKTVFQNRILIPVVCRFGDIQLPPAPEAKPHDLRLSQS